MKINRRTLLVTAGAGAGLAIGWAAWPRRRALNWAPEHGESVINAYVKIGVDGRVVVAVPQAEMGQGIWSGLAQIVADELGADWQAVGVEPSPLGPDYANKGMLIDQVSAMPAAVQGLANWAGGRAVEYFDFQITGGSNSIRGFEAPLRAAGATAREMLCRAAARRWSVDWRECDTEAGFVTHKANRLRFADVAHEATLVDAPATPMLRAIATTPETLRLSGRPLLRLDIPAKIDGSAEYGLDVRLAGMMYAAVEQGPLGATRASIDRSKLPAGARIVEGPGFTAVVADGWYAAKTALAAIVIRYTNAAKPAGPWLEADLKAALNGEGTSAGGAGTPSLDGGISADYSLPFLAHACLEPMNATARFENGKCEVWAPTQSMTLANWGVARALGIPEADVTIFPTLLGGGFGRKVEADAAIQAALISRAIKRPVQVIWSREEDFAHDMWRPAVAARMRGRVDGGKVTGWDAHFAVPDAGAGFMARNLPRMAGSPKAGAGAIEGGVELPYGFEAWQVSHSLGAQGLGDYPVPLGFWRSVGHSFTGFIVESFIDELAHSAGADPGAFRLALLKDSPRHAAVLRAALKVGGPLGLVEPGVGRGVALVESFGSIVAQVAEVVVRDNEPLRVTSVTAVVDCGRVINPDTVRAQVAGGIIYGLTAALHGRSTFANGAAEQRNFDTYPLLSIADAPAIEVLIMPSSENPGGIGEPGTPPIAPAVANALFAATGRRVRDLPLLGA